MAEFPSTGWNPQRLNEALKSSDLLTRIGAIRVVQEAPGDEYVQALAEALDDRDRLVRVNAAIALGRVKSPTAVIPLIRHAVSDPDAEVQSYALWAYRQVDYAKASPQLVELLTTSDSPAMVRFAANEVRQRADVKAIEAIVQRFQSRQLYTWNDLDLRAVTALYEIGNMAVEPLVKCLDDPDVRVQVNAIYALGRIGDERSVVSLIAHLVPANVEVRSRISDTLIKIGRPAIPDLVKLLDHTDRDIRWVAAYCLGSIGEDAEPVLLKTLQARGEKPSEDVVYALGMAGGRGAFAPLYKFYSTTRDDSVRAWSTIALANLVARCYDEVRDEASAGAFLDALGEQLKPHMLLGSETLLDLGKIYISRALSAEPARFTGNAAVAVKCFDLSLIEQENVLARAYRLFFSSYLKLMTSKSPEIMSYVEKDFADLRRDAERAEHKKEVMLLTGEVLAVLRKAYGDRGFDFAGRFGDYAELCTSVERFLPPGTAPREEAKRPGQKETAKLHTDVEIVQRKLSSLIERLDAAGDADAKAQALRLATELAKIDTGVYSDYRIAESCLKNVAQRLKMPDADRSDLLFKILMIGKNGLPQVELVVDQLLKRLEAEAKPVEPVVPVVANVRTEKKRSHLVEYVIIAALIVLIAAVAIVALNKLGYISLPFDFPVSWLNP
ncbi:MAG TPA: HEAT repeat domain-containing protein [Methanocella sp.]|nr:HEAT repeat domain-containing protein [Methanocella sp.]